MKRLLGSCGSAPSQRLSSHTHLSSSLDSLAHILVRASLSANGYMPSLSLSTDGSRDLQTIASGGAGRGVSLPRSSAAWANGDDAAVVVVGRRPALLEALSGKSSVVRRDLCVLLARAVPSWRREVTQALAVTAGGHLEKEMAVMLAGSLGSSGESLVNGGAHPGKRRRREEEGEDESSSDSDASLAATGAGSNLWQAVPVLEQVLLGCRALSLGDRHALGLLRDIFAPLIVRLVSSNLLPAAPGHAACLDPLDEASEAAGVCASAFLVAAVRAGALLLEEETDAGGSASTAGTGFGDKIQEAVCLQPMPLEPAAVSAAGDAGDAMSAAPAARALVARKLAFLVSCVRWDASAQDTMLATRLLVVAVHNLRAWYAAPVATARASVATAENEESKTFVPAASYGGIRPGYVFKAGDQGLGYYQDAAAASDCAGGVGASRPEEAVESVEELVVVLCEKMLAGLLQVRKASELFASAGKLLNAFLEGVAADRLLFPSSARALQSLLQVYACIVHLCVRSSQIRMCCLILVELVMVCVYV